MIVPESVDREGNTEAGMVRGGVYIKHMPEIRVGHLRCYVYGKNGEALWWHRLMVLTYMCFFIVFQFNLFPGPSCISHVTELWPMNF